MKQKIFSRYNEIKSMLEIIDNVELYKENSENGLVILLNGGWGTGKSTFLKELITYIKQDENIDLFNYYNAYENDCYDNAYIPFFASIASKIQLEEKFTNFIKSVSGGVVTGVAVCAISVTRSIFKNKFGVDLNEVADDLNEELSNYKDDYLTDYKNFCEHKSNIKMRMAKSCEDITQVFIIDELDRCKPSFAMDTLEIVKHFFDIKNCIFIISVDKIQLEESIKLVHGKEINSSKYFSKLFDYQFDLLPIGLKDIVDVSEDLDGDEFINYASDIFDRLNISLRDGKKILNELLGKASDWTLTQKKFMLFLFILKYTDLSFYNAIISGDYNKYKNIIEKQYDSYLEKYNKIFNYKIDKFSYTQIIEFICRTFNKKYSLLGDGTNLSYLFSGNESISINDMEKKLKEYLPLYDEDLSVKDSVIGLVG